MKIVYFGEDKVNQVLLFIFSQLSAALFLILN